MHCWSRLPREPARKALVEIRRRRFRGQRLIELDVGATAGAKSIEIETCGARAGRSVSHALQLAA
jgi:hypothetical protein